MSNRDVTVALLPCPAPCPFCRSVGGIVAGCFNIDTSEHEEPFTVRCANPECEAEGPIASSKPEAVAAWNRRSLSAEPPGEARPLRHALEQIALGHAFPTGDPLETRSMQEIARRALAEGADEQEPK